MVDRADFDDHGNLRSWQTKVPQAAQAGASPAPSERGWLIEHSGLIPGVETRGQISWLCVKAKHEGYGAKEFGYTHDAGKALRFARKEDAEAILALYVGAKPPDWYTKPFSVTEHEWPESAALAARQAPAAAAATPEQFAANLQRALLDMSSLPDDCGPWSVRVLTTAVRAIWPAAPQEAQPPDFRSALIEAFCAKWSGSDTLNAGEVLDWIMGRPITPDEAGEAQPVAPRCA